MEKPIYHRIQRGETLEHLSARYRVPVCMIVRANSGIHSETLAYGMTLTIPHKCYCGRCDAIVPEKPVPRFRYTEYVVQPGDTLYKIAQNEGLTMRILQKANRLNGIAELQPGTRMQIPAISGRRYYVRDGEDLMDIASRYGVPERVLREKNLIDDGECIGAGACLLI